MKTLKTPVGTKSNIPTAGGSIFSGCIPSAKREK
jgi:hypothetical protein